MSEDKIFGMGSCKEKKYLFSGSSPDTNNGTAAADSNNVPHDHEAWVGGGVNTRDRYFNVFWLKMPFYN